VKRLFSENVDLAQMAKTKMIFGKKKSRFGEKKAFLVIKVVGDFYDFLGECGFFLFLTVLLSISILLLLLISQ
jgi:hypothetical protein